MNMNTTEKRVFFILSVLLWAYLWLRAWLVPIIYDEVATFYHYVQAGEFLPWFAHWDANNHILNSALTILSYKLFGSSPLALRLPNLLVSILFFIYCYKIAETISNKYLRWVFILSLLLAHSFVDYFSLSRGYGMSMALLFGGIWYLMQSLKQANIKNYLLTLLFINLAVLANLTLIISAFVVMALLFLNLINRKNMGLPVIITIVAGLLPASFFIKLLFFMKAKGLLYYGSAVSFKAVTLWSLVKYFTGFESGTIENLLIVYFIIIVAVLAWLIGRMKDENPFSRIEFIFGFLLLGNVAGIFLNAWLFDVNYPEDRSGLFLFPFFIGSLIFVTDEIQLNMLKKIMAVLASLLLFFPLHFFATANFSHNSLENFRILQRFYDKVAAAQKTAEIRLTIGGSHNKELLWSYLNFRNGGKLSQMSTRSYPSMDMDFQITGYPNDPDWFTLYDSIDYDAQTQFYLVKRKQLLHRKIIQLRTGIVHKDKPNREYFSLLEGRADTLTGKSLVMSFNLAVRTENKPFDSWVVFTVKDKNKKTLRYERVPFNWLRTDWSNPEKQMVNTIYVKDLPPESDTYILFVWNIDKVPYEIVDGEAAVFVLNKLNPDSH
ncbi:MAG: glycosyltransferase family 39 protein [Bacteroidales bacterium]|nr:glycosyltransferase family 39 protein [Bacteroidales bacterium]